MKPPTGSSLKTFPPEKFLKLQQKKIRKSKSFTQSRGGSYHARRAYAHKRARRGALGHRARGPRVAARPAGTRRGQHRG